MEIETLGLFILTETLLSIVPGPAVLLVIGLSLRHGFKIGFGATLGVLMLNTFYFALSAFGVGALILTSATLFILMKWIGAAYLAMLGINMILPLLKSRFANAEMPDAGINLKEAKYIVKNERRDFGKSFIRGFMLQAWNPKILAFFLAILPQFISPEANVASQLLILGIASVLLELPILMFYGFASSKSAAMMKDQLIMWIEAVTGGILIAMGGALAMYKRGG